MKKSIKKLPHVSRPLVVLLVLVVLLSILSPNFLTVNNLMNVMRQVSINGMIAGGLTLVILTGGIDLSVGSILAYSGAIMALLMSMELPFPVALLAGLGIGLLFGLVNGTIITRFNVQPFIATLITMMFLRGATLVLTQGTPIGIPRDTAPALFEFLGRGNVLKVPVPMILTIVLYVILSYFLNQTKFGRHLYAGKTFRN